MTRTNCIYCFRTAMAAGLLLATCGVSSAQTGSLFGGNRGGTSSGSGGMSSATQNSSNSSSLFNSTSFGLNLGGGQNTAANTLRNSNANNSSLVGNGFVGRSDDTSDFIGRRSQTGAGSATGNRNGAQGNYNANNLRRNGNNQNRQRQQNNANNGNNQRNGNYNSQQDTTRSRVSRQIVTRHRIDFANAPVPDAAIQSKLESRFHGLITERINAKDLKFEIDPNGVLVMSGEVDSPQDKALASLIAGMEPGVHEVRNELAVTATPNLPANPQ